MGVKFQIDLDLPGRGKGDVLLKDISLWGSKNTGLFLIHGLTGTPNEMLFLARKFHEQGYSSFCPLLYKHGRPLRVLKYCRWEDFYFFLKKDFSKFRESLPQAKIFVSGLSMGALFALLLAYEFPRDITGIIALAPTLFYDGWNMPWLRILLPLVYLTPLKYFFYFKEEPPYGIKSKLIRQHVEHYYKGANLDDLTKVDKYGYPFIPVSLMQQLDRLAKFLIKRLGSIKAPIQIIQAENDDLASAENSRLIYRRIGSKDKEIVLLKDSYHVITADKERNRVFDLMRKFILRHNYS